MGQITRTQFGCVATKVFTNDQVLTFPTDTPIELIPAKSGVMYLLESCVMAYSWVADLGNVDAGLDVEISLGPVANGWKLPMPGVDGAGFLAAGSSALACNTGNLMFIDMWGNAVHGTDLAELVGMAVYLNVDNQGTGDFTDGDPGNVLTVKLFYDTISI